MNSPNITKPTNKLKVTVKKVENLCKIKRKPHRKKKKINTGDVSIIDH